MHIYHFANHYKICHSCQSIIILCLTDLDPFQIDSRRHGPIESVVLLHVRPDHEHLAPGLRVGVQLHDLGEADKLVLVERPGV